MKILEVKLRNVKSFGKNTTTILLKDGINTIVGENNVGKSNVLSIIRNLRDNLLGQYQFAENDWHEGDIDNPMEIIIRVSIDDEDIKYLLGHFNPPLGDVDEFRRSFGSEVIIPVIYAKKKEGPLGVIQIGNMYAQGNTVSPNPIDPRRPYSMIAWKDVARRNPEPGKSIRKLVEEAIMGRPEEMRVDFHTDFSHIIGSLLSERIIVFPEFRERPQKTAGETLSSPSGREISSVLFNLKNGSKKERDRFKRIQDDFSQLFPTLKIDVMKKGPEIVIERVLTGHELPLDFVGAGIAEMLIILTHMVASENKVILIDEPELHLHPHSQRLLYEVLKGSSKRNQLLIVTHSPLFISMDNISDLILLRELRGESVAIQLPQDYFAKNEALRLERIVRSEDKEFFFSRGVILVEGETESGAVPVFSNKLGKSLDKEGISVVCVGGNYFGMFVKLLIGFHFPYLVLCDRDVGNRISHTIPIGSSTCATSSLFHQLHQLSLLDSEDMAKLREFEGNITEKSENGKSLKEYNEAVFQQIREIAIKHRVFVLTSDFEGILSNAGYDGLLKESRKHFSRSKVLQGRFVAEEAESVPKEIGEAIDLLYDQLAMKKHS